MSVSLSDAIVIGGGIRGVAIALNLTQSGLQTIVVGESDPGGAARPASGHCRHGVLMAPLTGRLIAQAVVEKTHPSLFDACSARELVG